MISKSSERNTFLRDKYIQRRAEDGKTPENDEDVKATVDYYNSWTAIVKDREADDEWKKTNLEYDLRSTEWILEKVRNSDTYAQHLYAAMCNTDFTKNEIWPILKEDTWSCSWRHAGGIIADMRMQGDYIDWYCSGMTGSDTDAATVREGVVTDEIRADLLKLGWIVKE